MNRDSYPYKDPYGYHPAPADFAPPRSRARHLYWAAPLGLLLTILFLIPVDDGTVSRAIAGGCGIVALIALYWLPSIIGMRRNVPNLGVITVINFLAGWTFIGWVIALAMSARDVPAPRASWPTPYPPYPNSGYEPQPTNPSQPQPPIYN